MTDQEKSVPEQLEILTPGQMLARAREARRLSPADIAEKMRLSVQIVKDLEADDYRHIPAPIYVKGYLRSYARLVDLSEQDALSGLKEAELPRQPSLQERLTSVAATGGSIQSTINHRERGRSGWFRWFTVAVILILLVLVIMWWVGQRNSQTSIALPNNTTPVQQPFTAAKPSVKKATVATTPKFSKKTHRKSLVKQSQIVLPPITTDMPQQSDLTVAKRHALEYKKKLAEQNAQASSNAPTYTLEPVQ